MLVVYEFTGGISVMKWKNQHYILYAQDVLLLLKWARLQGIAYAHVEDSVDCMKYVFNYP